MKRSIAALASRVGFSRFDQRHDCAPEVVYAFNPQRYGANPEVERRPASRAVEAVFLRADHATGANGASRRFDYANVVARIAMVIGEKLVPDNLKTPIAQVSDKSRRIPDSAKREELFFARFPLSQVRMKWRKNGFKFGAGVKYRSLRFAVNGRLPRLANEDCV